MTAPVPLPPDPWIRGSSKFSNYTIHAADGRPILSISIHCSAQEADAIAAAVLALPQMIDEIEALKTMMEVCVQERLEELNAEGEAFDRECWGCLRKLCEDNDIDWQNYPDEMTADDAYQYLAECFSAFDRENKRLRAAVLALPALIEALEMAREELRLIRMKDHGTIYQPGLSVLIDLALAAARGEGS